MIKALLLAATVSLAFAIAANSSNERADPQIVPLRINDRVHVLYGGNGLGSNVGVIQTADGLVLVDTMWGRSSEKLAAALADIDDGKVSHVFNTHRHDDHASGNSAFVDKGATLVRQASAPDGGEARQIRFKEKLALALGGVRFEAYAITSHTSEDALIFLPGENVMFLGDTFTTRWHPTFYSGGEEGQLAVLEKALALADDNTVVVPGHGFVAGREGLVIYRDAFRQWIGRMRELSEKGLTVEQMEADAGLKAISSQFLQDGSRDEIPGTGYRRFIERTISTELKPIDEAVLAQLERYVGNYRYEDGMALRIVSSGAELHVYEDGKFSGSVVPLSKDHFHYPGRLEGEGHLTFQFDGDDKVVSATFVGESQSWVAQRLAD